MIGKARFHFIKKGISLQDFKVSAMDDVLYPYLSIQFNINSKTDATVSVNELSAVVKCSEWNLGLLIMRPTDYLNSLPKKIKGRKNCNDIIGRFYPPLFFWLQQPRYITLAEGRLLLDSIWGHGNIDFSKDGLEIKNLEDVSKKFREKLQNYLRSQ